MMDHPARLRRLRQRLAQSGPPALLVIEAANRVYLSGFTGTAGTLLVTADGAWLITDFRYAAAARSQVPAFEVVQHSGRDQLEVIGGLLARAGVTRLGFEAAHVTFHQHQTFAEAWPGVALIPQAGVVEELRLVKDAEEIACIRQAMAYAETAFAQLLPEVKPGRRERDLALELEVIMRRLGADAAAFDFIVASGPRSALPHGYAADRLIEAGDLVTFDFGARYRGYHSDITRTVVAGQPDARQREIYGVVQAAQRAGLAAVRDGVTGAEVDRAAREVITAAGYGENFGHGTGHGIGLDVHENPRLSPGRDQDVLRSGMVVTVEPGIYLPGWGGVRIEDTVMVTPEGCDVLCTTSKELLCL